MQYRVALITKARLMRGWTKAQLAKAVERDPATISRIESGQFVGNPPTMKRIADVLNIPMEEFILADDVVA